MTSKKESKVNPLRRIVERLSDAAGYFSSAAIIIATLVIVHQVVARYVFNIPTIWQVEMAVYLLIAATFIGAAYGLKENSHINIELVTGLLSSKPKRILDLATSIVSFCFCVYIAWKGGVMWLEAYEGGWTSESLYSVPLVYPYAIIPIGFGLTSAQYVLKIIDQTALLICPAE